MSVKALNFTTKQKRFISQEIESGRYVCEEDVIRASVDLLQKHQGARQALLDEIDSGIKEFDAGLGVTTRTREELTALLDDLAVKAGVRAPKLKKRAGRSSLASLDTHFAR